MPLSLRDATVLCLDCQTTGRFPQGAHLLELGWALTKASEFLEDRAEGLTTRLISLPPDATLSPQVQRLTGLDETRLAEASPEPAVWDELQGDLLRAATAGRSPAFAIAHYARFERSFLTPLESRYGKKLAPDTWLCTQEIARKLFPGAPSTGIRAMSGFFGVPLPEVHRAEVHLKATLRIWHHLVDQLDKLQGIQTLEALTEWLRTTKASRASKRTYLVDREARLALPEKPGVYRMLGKNGTLLYVGKATSLRSRVNSYFRHRAVGRLNEWLTQVSRIEHTETPTAVEAALLETDLIKALNPPYNVSLREQKRKVWYFSKRLTEGSSELTPDHPFGPFASRNAFETLNEVGMALGNQIFGDGLFQDLDDVELFEAGAKRIFPDYPKDRGCFLSNAPLIRAGFAFLAKEREEETEIIVEEADEPSEAPEPEWTAERIERRLRRTLRHSALRLWRARWSCRLTEMSVAWQEAGEERWRLLMVENGNFTQRDWIRTEDELPVPPGWRKTISERAKIFDVTTLDRLRVLGTELRQVASNGGTLRGKLSPHRSFGNAALLSRFR